MRRPVDEAAIPHGPGDQASLPDSTGRARREMEGFHRLSPAERRQRLLECLDLDSSAFDELEPPGGLDLVRADRMVENVIGVFSLPLGLCLNLRVDGTDRVVPMVTEEPSVIAAASHAAKLLRAGGGANTEVSAPLMEGQVQLLDVPDGERAEREIERSAPRLLDLANQQHGRLTASGGGAREVTTRRLAAVDEDDVLPEMLIVQLLVDVREAMGANIVNSMCEAIAPELEALSGGRARLRILTNLCHRRTVTVHGSVPISVLQRRRGARGDHDLARGIVEASIFAERDPFRAATHNKGIMNGVDAVLLAFGQDFRAAEAGAHAYAAQGGRYAPLSRWRLNGERLVGRLTLPLAVGVVGGTLRANPAVKAALRFARVDSASALASVAASVGLAQNLAALRALAGEGIQNGHLRLHARHLCFEAGARGEQVDRIARAMAAGRTLSVEAAGETLRELEAGDPDPDFSYCAAALPRVSRTFALSIEALPEALRHPVTVSYLLCRIVDTVEDAPRQAAERRASLFNAFETPLLDDDAPALPFAQFFAQLPAAFGADEDLELCRHADAVFRAFRGLPRGQRDLIRSRVLEMSQGMRRYCAELDRSGRLWIEDEADLRRYCYYVAGTVGELLTGLFEQHMGGLDAKTLEDLRVRAVPFGLALQTVNILKDVGEDLQRGVCYLPRNLLEPRGVSFERILEPESRERVLSVVHELGRGTRQHLNRAREYTLLWPGARGAPVRLFCAIPLALAFMTFRELEAGDDALRLDRTPKVGRQAVREISARATRAAADPAALRAMLEEYGDDAS